MVQGDGITDYEQGNQQAQPAAQQQQQGGGMMNRMRQGMSRYRGGQNQQGGGAVGQIMHNQQQSGPGVSGPPGQPPAQQSGNAGWRGDGGNVPGNQPGGANGAYGASGQNPQPPSPSNNTPGRPSFGASFGNNIAKGQKPGIAAINAGISRYRGPQQGAAGPPQQGVSQGAPPTQQPMSGGTPDQSPLGQGGGGAMPTPPSSQPEPADTPTAGAASSPPQSNAIMSGGMPAMKDGGIVNKPTVAMLGEHGPEAVIPLSGQNPDAKLSPGMFSKTRYRRPTGPSSVHGPIRPLEPLAPSKVMR